MRSSGHARAAMRDGRIPRISSYVAVAGVALLFVAASVRGEEPSLGEVTVRADRLPDEAVLQDRTAFATVIDTSEKTAEVDTVSDLLAETVGIQVRRFGGLGDFSTLSVRGSAANQVQVYLDGIPMSRAQNEVVNLATLPLGAVDHVEVYRGFVPIAFSRAGPGGVVNIVTKTPGELPRTQFSTSYGSFDYRSIKAMLRKGLDLQPFEQKFTRTWSQGSRFARTPNGTLFAGQELIHANH